MGYCPTRLDHACPAGRHVVEHRGLHAAEAGVFPGNQHAAFFVDLYQTQGTDIHASDRMADRVRKRLLSLEGVTEVSTWAGRGPVRFTMILLPERPDPAYAQLV
ncbi:MAG: hypothetical protein CM15mP74_28850 [Halieaceae bacterium]|nr:MAG: hypothetical protein CM15mP74_28850 [Halieaceae bacterium]